jgi:protein gp37
MAARLQGFGYTPYQGTVMKSKAGPVWTGKVNRSTDATMRKPLSIWDPSLIFTCSMADFWNMDAQDEWRKEALAIMRQTSRHRYQILTKRPQNIAPILERMGEALPDNVWLGATVEDRRVTDRITILREVPARIRFLSVEPMTAPLGAVDLTGIHWVIVGGESGPGARPMDPAWCQEVLDQCLAQGVAFFMKQGSANNWPRYKDFLSFPKPLQRREFPEQLR